MQLYPKIQAFITTINVSTISAERKQVLKPLINFITEKAKNKQAIRLNFICTHNSRRSHLSQMWAQTMAAYFSIPVTCYSAGTETTAIFPEVLCSLKKVGFQTQKLSEGSNPLYSIKFAKNEHPIIGFSKTITHPFNPQTEFCSIMTCDSAYESCPIVPGAENRIPITYMDPKKFDNTPLQAEKYLERSTQIATEMYFVFSQIK